MIDLEYSFGTPDYGALLQAHIVENTLSAARFLTVMEGYKETEVEEALTYLAQNGIMLDVSDLPKPVLSGDSAARLRQEAETATLPELIGLLDDRDPLRLYLQEVGIFADTTVDPHGSMDIQVEAMLGEAVALAREYVGKGVLLLDLIQEANLGLWEAVQTYETGDYIAYCRWWMRQRLAGAVTMQARQTGVGQMLRQALEDYRAVDEKLLVELGRNPTREEIAQAMHMGLEETEMVASVLEAARNMMRVKKPEPDQLPQEEDQAVEDTAYFQMRERISQLLCQLDETQAKLLTLRYGLEGGLPMEAAEVAKKLGMTQQEVVKAEASALAQLRQQNEKK